MLEEHINTVLKKLTPCEEQVLRMSYGLDGGRIHTLYEVGKELNITRKHIMQIKVKAFRMMCHPIRNKGEV